MISSFKDEYFFLSNFYPAQVTYDGITYQNTEAAFQAQKEANKEDRKFYADLNPSEAKRRGRHCNLRKDWEQAKVQEMYNILLLKFEQHPDLKRKLVDTAPEQLIEGNDWGDKVWGAVWTGNRWDGANTLGKLLMNLRTAYIRGDL